MLLLGADYGANSSFHLSEYRARSAVEIEQGAPLLRAGQRQWVTYQDIEFHEENSPGLSRDFEATNTVIRGEVGAADCRLFSQRACVDLAVDWVAAARADPDSSHPSGPVATDRNRGGAPCNSCPHPA